MTQWFIQNISNKLKETMQQLKRNKFQDKLEVAVFLKNDKYSKVILISKMKFVSDLSLMTKPHPYPWLMINPSTSQIFYPITSSKVF